jgi:hypothetical protein
VRNRELFPVAGGDCRRQTGIGAIRGIDFARVVSVQRGDSRSRPPGGVAVERPPGKIVLNVSVCPLPAALKLQILRKPLRRQIKGLHVNIQQTEVPEMLGYDVLDHGGVLGPRNAAPLSLSVIAALARHAGHFFDKLLNSGAIQSAIHLAAGRHWCEAGPVSGPPAVRAVLVPDRLSLPLEKAAGKRQMLNSSAYCPEFYNQSGVLF